MHLTILCVGRLSSEYAAVQERYLRMLRPYAEVEVVEVGETPLTQGAARVLTTEGERLRRRVRPGAYTVALDRRGKQVDSQGLSALLAEQKLYGRSDFQFILGGALGLHERVVAAADFVWSLSELTFPHQLARCIVLEQLYRAARIERGEPYHH